MLADETLMTFADAARHLPRSGKRKISVSTVWRWHARGVRGCKLEARLFGGRFFTSVEALDRFGKALAETSPSVPDQVIAVTGAARKRTTRQRQQAHERAMRKLEAAGI